MSNKILVIGHKSPDLDSVAGAISYANLKNKLENTDIYEPVICGDFNKETSYVLDKFQINKPQVINDLSGKNVIQVDHNEFSQAANGIENAKVVEVLDHHKVVYNYPEPIYFKVLPWGSVCTIIADMYLKNNIEIDQKMASLMLSAILVDTVITKSPTCTPKDLEIIEKLANISKLQTWKDYGMEIFKVRSSVNTLTDNEVIKSDFKDFMLKSGKFGIGQVETVDIKEFKEKEDSIIKELDKIRQEEAYHSVVLFITDIIKEGSLFLVSTSDQTNIELAIGGNLQNSRVYINGIISRKKQVAPKFSEVFDK